jgi:hypothetical protein
MSKNLLLPVLLAGAIGLPYLIFQNSERNSNPAPLNQTGQNSGFSMPVYQASTSFPPGSNVPATQTAFGSANFSNPAFQTGSLQAGQVPAELANYPSTVVLPGTANSPDFNSAPMEFLPINNLQEIIRFDATADWIKSRWPRVSMTPVDGELRGMRVALVTGTNASDLHGSLTYHFDRNQRVQRIAFQGWTGETTRLLNLLTQQYQFKRKPTHLAGLYVSANWSAQKGALLMQHPEVIRRENPTQQLGIVLEINNPDSNFALSPQVSGMVRAASN